MTRSPHRTRRGRWGRDLDINVSGENWAWRLLLPWVDHYTVAVCVVVGLLGIDLAVKGEWLWTAVETLFIAGNVWGMRRRHHNRRVMREDQYLFNAWEAVDSVDGEGPTT